MPQVYTLSFALFCRWATPRAESWHGPVPVIHLRIAARCHRLIRGERGSSFVWGQTLPAHPGHILGVPSRSRGWAAPASDTVTSNIVNNAVAVRRTIGLTHKSFWRAVVTKHVAQWKRIGLHCVLSQANVHCSPRLRLICACIFPTGLAFNTELLRFFFLKSQSLRVCYQAWAKSKRERNKQLWFYSFLHLRQSKDWILKERKNDGWNASSEKEGKLLVKPQATFNIQTNSPEGLDRASQF